MPSKPSRARRPLPARALKALARVAGRARGSVLGDEIAVPRRWERTETYAERTGAVWRRVEPPSAIVRRAPVSYGSAEADFAPMLESAFPAQGVLELSDGILFGQRGWVVSADGYLLPEHSLFGTRVDEMPLRDRPTTLRRVRGVVASLATDNSWRNYGHFLYDALPRVDLLRRAGYDLGEIDWFLCGYPGKKAARLLERLGVPFDRIIPVEHGVSVRADRVLAPSFPGARFDHPRWVIDFLRRELLPAGTPIERRRRLYVRRTASRRLANEAEVMPLLEAHGFEPYEPERNPEPPVDFAQADAVFGVHGANLADIAFCAEGAAVLELTPTEHVHPYWYSQADTAGLRHGYILCPSTDQRAPGAHRAGDADVRVDPAELERALVALSGHRAADHGAHAVGDAPAAATPR